ncbi:hypothetical protein D3C75_1231950 [compost metagenome]
MKNATTPRSIAPSDQPNLKHVHERLNGMLTSAENDGLLRQLANRKLRQKAEFSQ